MKLFLKILIFFTVAITESLAIQFDHDKVQKIIDAYFLAKNSTNTIRLPKLNLTDDDKSCLMAGFDIGRLALNFLTKCGINKRDKINCMEPSWAVRILDALPTKPSGISRRGPFFFLGDYETCKDIWNVERKSVHYCTGKGNLKNIGKTIMPPVTFGICLPSQCGKDQIKSLIDFSKQSILKELLEDVQINCADGQNNKLSSRKPFLMLTIFIFVFLISSGTILENMKRKGGIQIKNARKDCEDRSDCGQEESVGGSVYDAYAPSIALTYRSSPRNFVKSSVHTLFVEILTSFSIRSSFSYLFRNSTREVQMVNGMRVLSTFWVIFSHTCLFSLQFTDTVRQLSVDTDEALLSSFMLNSSLSVDTFLFLSACVATYSIRKRMIFRDSEVSIFRTSLLLVHRILRFFPSIIMYLLFMSLIYNHLGDGPFWNSEGMFGSQCSTIWSIWPHFTFLSNFIPSKCVPWLWYIALDFQLYLTLPFSCFILAKFRLGYTVIVLLVGICLIYRTIMYTVFTLPPNMFVEMLSGNFEKSELSYRLLYTSPISRAPPFLIGVLTGWIICSVQKRKLNWCMSMGYQLMGFGLLALALFGPFSGYSIVQYTHSITHRTIWAIGIAIFVILAQNGHSGIVGWMSDQRFIAFSRLSFGVFLCHEPILLFYLNTLRQPLSPSSFSDFLFISLSVYVISIIFATMLAIAIEIPLLRMERKFLMTTRKLEKEVDGEEEDERLDIELGHEEMKFNEKTMNWLQNYRRGEKEQDMVTEPLRNETYC